MKNEERPVIEKICRFCENALDIADESTVLCRKKGVVSETGSCRSFRYDPIKRVPQRNAVLPDIDPEDIVL